MTKPKLSEPEDNVSSEEGTDNETADENDVPINHEKITDYEKQRLHRIEENKKRMEALGLPKMASSFMGSVPKTQKKSNDKKGKKKIDIDEEYNPTQEDEEMSCSEDEDDNDDEFSPSKKTKVLIILVTSVISYSVPFVCLFLLLWLFCSYIMLIYCWLICVIRECIMLDLEG